MHTRRLTVAILGVAALLTFADAAGTSLAAAECKGNSHALGVSRVLKIDTTAGPKFGRIQYKDKEILADKEVVLTFDDGPLAHNTRKVLDALAAHCTKATFFMVGRMAVAYPAMVREVAAAGHTVGIHTWSHRNLKAISPARAAGEIELGASAVAQALGKPVAPFFRFPYLSDPHTIISYLQSRHVGIFSIGVDSLDFRTSSGARMRRTVMRQLKERGRGIILMHDIQRSTAHGIKGLLDDLAEGGYKVVHIVPAEDLKTRPEYDTYATELHKRRRTLAKAPPLHDPSIKWAANTPSPRPYQAASTSEDKARSHHAAPKHTSGKAPPERKRRHRTAAASSKPMQSWKRRVLGLD